LPRDLLANCGELTARAGSRSFLFAAAGLEERRRPRASSPWNLLPKLLRGHSDYPTNCPDYPTNCPDYPTNCPDYPTNCPGYPTNCPGFPTNCPGFPPRGTRDAGRGSCGEAWE
jgi:hypothetical protein